MSVKKLLSDDQLIILYNEYHSYICYCKTDNFNPTLNRFFTRIKKTMINSKGSQENSLVIKLLLQEDNMEIYYGQILMI